MAVSRRIDVTVGFIVHTDTDEDADEFGRELIGHLAFIGNPRRVPEAVVFIRATEVWECSGCGTTEGRYDNGEACEKCVMDSFAESG